MLSQDGNFRKPELEPKSEERNFFRILLTGYKGLIQAKISSKQK
jgi:hypothetical protein